MFAVPCSFATIFWTVAARYTEPFLGLTAVVGLRDFYKSTRTGDEIIVDAQRGEVILNPLATTIGHYKFSIPTSEGAQVESGAGPVMTADGVTIALRANVELPAELDAVRKFGACGVGLFRSEFLLSRPGMLVSEDEQFEAYKTLAEATEPDGSIIRLFDLGGETGYELSERPERNPALGLRAIRFGLKNEQVMRSQVRAILRAARFGNLKLVIPMVADVSDVTRAKRVIDEERNSLSRAGVECGEAG